MQKIYHRLITTQALGETFSPLALETVITANLAQDRILRGQISHGEYHFDQNAFAAGWAYIEHNRGLVRPALEAGDTRRARQALGRLTHAAQDLYAHSNYVALWLARFPPGKWPPPGEIDPFDADLLTGPDLRSGKIYYPLEALSYVPFLKKIVLQHLPRDSHAWMNLDAPERGPEFFYACAAAVKRTRHEYERTVQGLPVGLVSVFCDKNTPSREV
jgi:hypothetical protein